MSVCSATKYKRILTVSLFIAECIFENGSHLNEGSWCELLGVNDQLRAVPEGQCITEENDAPQIALKYANDCPFLHPPGLSFFKVLVISADDKNNSK